MVMWAPAHGRIRANSRKAAVSAARGLQGPLRRAPEAANQGTITPRHWDSQWKRRFRFFEMPRGISHHGRAAGLDHRGRTGQGDSYPSASPAYHAAEVQYI